ncbi:B12-binding domain-containing radical SAM protein, partial [Paraburkholderia aspalathi]
MATVPVTERENFWRNFDIRYHAAHPGLRHMKNVLWELPHWMTWLAGVLVDAGYRSMEALDLYASECTMTGIDTHRLERVIRSTPGDVYLLSPMTPNLPFGLQIADLIKEIYPAAKVILGGVVATPLHKQIAAHPSVDYVVFGRGERALPDLLQAIEGKISLDDVGNVSARDRDGKVQSSFFQYPWVPVNDIPPPKVDLFDSSVGEDIRYLRQVYALGCPFKCSFCTIQTIGQKADYFNLDRVIAEIHEYRSHYGEHHNVYFGDETFTVNKERTLDICSALRNDGTIGYDIQTRLNCLTDDGVLKALKESGCRWVEIGIETINQDSQNVHKQRVKL